MVRRPVISVPETVADWTMSHILPNTSVSEKDAPSVLVPVDPSAELSNSGTLERLVASAMDEWPPPFSSPYVAESLQTCCSGNCGVPLLAEGSDVLFLPLFWLVATTEGPGSVEDFGAIAYLTDD